MKFITLNRIDERIYGYDETTGSSIVERRKRTPVIINPGYIICMAEYFTDDDPGCLDYTLIKLTNDVNLKVKHKIKEIIEIINATEENNDAQ